MGKFKLINLELFFSWEKRHQISQSNGWKFVWAFEILTNQILFIPQTDQWLYSLPMHWHWFEQPRLFGITFITCSRHRKTLPAHPFPVYNSFRINCRFSQKPNIESHYGYDTCKCNISAVVVPPPSPCEWGWRQMLYVYPSCALLYYMYGKMCLASSNRCYISTKQ